MNWKLLLVDFLMGGARPPQWKYVGQVELHITSTHPTHGENKFDVPILFFMTEQGDRKFEIVTKDKEVLRFIEDRCTEHNHALAWQKGGPFPDRFEPQADVLGPMLSKMIDARLTGQSDE